jgi:hypothetical protein
MLPNPYKSPQIGDSQAQPRGPHGETLWYWSLAAFAVSGLFGGVAVMQLLAIFTGGYDPVRDDGLDPSQLPAYYFRLLSLIATFVPVCIVSFVILCGPPRLVPPLWR